MTLQKRKNLKKEKGANKVNEIDEILGTTTKTNNYSTNRKYNNYPKKNDWKEKQAQDRQ